MFYVSYITEYPIYEPAEGGYYYAGETVQQCRAFHDWKKANRLYQSMKKAFMEEYHFEDGHVVPVDCGGCGKYVNPVTLFYSRYIGEGARVQITRTEPRDIGQQIYC
ncbi:MAG: hypothetical protein IJV40_11040 [Oscillospiraceae bacterium]|nr:hypothetical protein [Oscillospiraceae bacterium]